jgi:hypothetical protein
MTTRTQQDRGTEPNRDNARLPYAKPEIKRVDLALEETLSAGCKLNGTECTDPFPGVSEAGS